MERKERNTNLSKGINPSLESFSEVELLDQAIADADMSITRIDSWKSVWGSVFSAGKFYTFCFRRVEAPKPFKWIWKSKITMKVKVFAWLLLRDRLNTRNMLNRRNFMTGDDLKCVLCDTGMEETLNHLFINRPFSFECWLQLGIHWPLDANCLEILPEIKANFGSPIFFEVFVLAAWNI